ncbi:hypothetical protein [Kordiimonas marina]|nr:hypothetical protein [Kordiimonas marina]MCJ9427567.1 hypothetical protein [Kordiimonas marina]
MAKMLALAVVLITVSGCAVVTVPVKVATKAAKTTVGVVATAVDVAT